MPRPYLERNVIYMRIKHWQGYGTVTAKKIRKTIHDGITTLVVEVRGNHEWGLARDDVYDLKRWLVDRFDKSARDISPYVIDYDYTNDYVTAPNGLDEERCIYTFEYMI